MILSKSGISIIGRGLAAGTFQDSNSRHHGTSEAERGEQIHSHGVCKPH